MTSELADPFQAIWLQPGYGAGQVVIYWTLPARFQSGRVFALRSPNGMPQTWVDIEGGSAPASSSIIAELPRDSITTDHHFRLVLEFEGQDYVSRSVNLFGALTQLEYATMASMIAQQIAQWQLGDGIRLLHYVPSPAGEITPGITSALQLEQDASCPDAPAAHETAPFGYLPPILVWAKFPAGVQQQETDDADGAGRIVSKTQQVVLLAHPKPGRDHLLVNPFSDERWALSDSTKTYAFKGIAPLRYVVTAQVLNRADPRYRVPVPSDVYTQLHQAR